VSGESAAGEGAATSRALIWAALAVLILIWGTTWAAIRIGLEGLPPFTGASLRFILAGILLLVLARALKVPRQSGARLRWLWWIEGLFAFGVSYGIVYWAEQWVPSGMAAVLFSTFPFFVAILAHLWLEDESLHWLHLVGIAIGSTGVALISADDIILESRQQIVASFVMLGSPMAAAVAHVQVKKWGQGLHPLNLAGVPMLAGGIAAGLVALLMERQRAFTFDARAVGAVLYLAIAGSAVTFTVYYWLLGRVPASRLALITYGIPVVAVMIGTLGLGEPMTVQTLAGSALVIGGVGVALRA
jgi:drug/metabolite transporter (DMT)-like permease